MYDLTLEEAKITLKKLQEDKKQVLKGKTRNFLTVPLIKVENIVDFSMKQYQNFHECAHLERQRAINALNDRESLAATGIFDKKIDTIKEEKIRVWTENIQPKITENIWDIEFEEKSLISYIKSFTNI